MVAPDSLPFPSLNYGPKSGFYAGTWASNMSRVADGYPVTTRQPGPSASLDRDFYGGYKGGLPADFGHLGNQYFRNNGSFDYGNWKIGASTEIYGVAVGLYGTGTNAQDAAYTNIHGKNISANQFVAFLQKTF